MESLRNKISKAVKVLKEGGVVVFPTETAFGVGCRIDDRKAVRRLMELKRRPKKKPFLALAADFQMVRKYWRELPVKVKDLAKKFWPGPLTIIYFCQKRLVPVEVRGEGATLGIRVPGYELSRSLVKLVGVPILAPSANFLGEPAPFKIKEVNLRFLKKVDFFLKEKCGGFISPSTIINCAQKPFTILRKGAIKNKELTEFPFFDKLSLQ